MGDIWRLVDTGLRSAAQNIALSRAMLEARNARETPGTLRFARFMPSALLGVHQSAEQEFHLSYCRAHGIDVQRRITGGAAAYASEAQLLWELHLQQCDVGCGGMPSIARRIGHAAATAIAALGAPARYRARDEIAVDGRRIASMAGMGDGSAVLYHGIVYVELDYAALLSVQRFPSSARADVMARQARQRIASLVDVLGDRPDGALLRGLLTEAFESEFNIEFREGDLTLSEHARYRAALAAVDTSDWVNLVSGAAADAPYCEAAHSYATGVLKANLIYDRPRHRIRQIWFGGDIAVTPESAIAELEAALQDTGVERLERNVSMFFGSRRVQMAPLTPADFIAAAQLAAKQPLVAPGSC